MLNAQEIKQAAQDLYQAELDRKQIKALSFAHPDMDIADSYAIQQAIIDLKIAAGRKIVGRKVGLTSRAMQMAMGIDEPDFGTLLDDMVFENGSTLKAADFLDPKIEVELSFVLKEKLQGDNLGIEDVLKATDYLVPSIELIAARSYRVDPETGKRRTVKDTIADNAANAGIMTNDVKIDPRDPNLRWIGAMLYRNGIIEETGLAAGVLDHPALGIVWLAKRFTPHGIALEPGQIILAGSFTRPVDVRAGDDFRVDFGHYGAISCHFE